MTGKASYRVESDALKYGHNVSSGSAWVVRKALCGKNPFPDRWYRPVTPTKPLCPNCYVKAGIT